MEEISEPEDSGFGISPCLNVIFIKTMDSDNTEDE